MCISSAGTSPLKRASALYNSSLWLRANFLALLATAVLRYYVSVLSPLRFFLVFRPKVYYVIKVISSLE